MEEKELKKLKNNLPVGGIKRIAEDLNISESGVSHILNGKRNNLRVIEKAIELAKENIAKRKELSEEINNL